MNLDLGYGMICLCLHVCSLGTSSCPFVQMSAHPSVHAYILLNCLFIRPSKGFGVTGKKGHYFMGPKDILRGTGEN